MAAGRRTWVISVFILGIVVLWVMHKRLKSHAGVNKLFKDLTAQMKPKVRSNGGDTVEAAGIPGDMKPSNILRDQRTTYLKEITVPNVKVKRTQTRHSAKRPLPSVPPVIKLAKPTNESQFPTCDYPNPPSRGSFNDEPQRWQTVAQRTIMVFSAYLDDRKEIRGPVIRVLASGKQTKFGHSGVVSCVLWFKEGSKIIALSAEAEYEVIYESRLHPSMYTAHFIHCKLKETGISVESILGVSVVPKPCGIVSNVQKLTRSHSVSANKTTFSLCLSPIYGNYDNAAAIIENFEMHKILGVERITVYLLSVGPTVGSVLKKYQAEGLVDIVNWRYPYSTVLCDYFAQREALNDCLYRNMGRTRFLALVDLDEIITPRKTLVWDAMMTRIYKPERGAYLFQHAYFLKKQPKSSKPTLLTQSVFSRPNEVYPPGKIRCKAIYEVEKTVKVNIHFPYTLLPGFQEYIVPPEEAILHHYRSEVMRIFHDGKKTFTYFEDTYMVNYANRIRKAFAHRLKQFNIV